MNNISYVEIIGEEYPNISVSCSGNPLIYENIIHAGGDPLPSKEELDAAILNKIRLRKWRAIQAERDRRKANGVKIGDNWFHSDDSSRIQQIALVIFGENLPANIMWKTLNGTFVEMTPTLAIQIFQASAAQDIAIFTVAEQHKAAMMVSENPAEYDFSAGWPETYTGSLLL